MPQSQIQPLSTQWQISKSPTSLELSAMRCCSSPALMGRAPILSISRSAIYTSVAGLGLSRTMSHQWFDLRTQPMLWRQELYRAGELWRSLSNLTINVNTPNFGCYNGNFGPCRRPLRCAGSALRLRTLMDYCTPPSFASGASLPIPSSTAAPLSMARSSSGCQKQQARRLDKRRLEPGVSGS